MKNIISISILILLFLSLNSCEDDYDPKFEVQLESNVIQITSTVADNYLISEEIKENIADRIIWDKFTTGVPTNISYEVQLSSDITMNNFTVLETTNKESFALKVRELLKIGEDLGLDNDPNTLNGSGLPNDKGSAFVRVKAIIGSSTDQEFYSETQVFNFAFIEASQPINTCPSLYLAGTALTDIGADWNPDGEIICRDNILERKFAFQNGTFLFYESIASSLDYNYFVNEGYNFEYYLFSGKPTENFSLGNSGDGSFQINGGAPGFYEISINQDSKSFSLKSSGPIGIGGKNLPNRWQFWNNPKRLIEVSLNVWKGAVDLSQGDPFRFFKNFYSETNAEKFDTENNYAYYSDLGYTIDSQLTSEPDGDMNFIFNGASGEYTITIDAVNKTITVE